MSRATLAWLLFLGLAVGFVAVLNVAVGHAWDYKFDVRYATVVASGALFTAYRALERTDR